MAGQRPGPQQKGGKRLPVRFPEDQLARYAEEARRVGLSLSDYLANAVATHHGLPQPWPAGPVNQPSLVDIGEAA